MGRNQELLPAGRFWAGAPECGRGQPFEARLQPPLGQRLLPGLAPALRDAAPSRRTVRCGLSPVLAAVCRVPGRVAEGRGAGHWEEGSEHSRPGPSGRRHCSGEREVAPRTGHRVASGRRAQGAGGEATAELSQRAAAAGSGGPRRAGVAVAGRLEGAGCVRADASPGAVQRDVSDAWSRRQLRTRGFLSVLEADGWRLSPRNGVGRSPRSRPLGRLCPALCSNTVAVGVKPSSPSLCLGVG